MDGVPTSKVKIASCAASWSTVAATYCGCSGESFRLLAPHVDLDHRHAVGQEWPVGEVGAEHDQRVAVLHGPVPGAEPDQPGHPDVVGVVVLDDFLAAERVHHRGLQRARQADQLVVRTGTACPGENGHRCSVIQ
jgi:hypothetical protein